jgi:hypothetical protein
MFESFFHHLHQHHTHSHHNGDAVHELDERKKDEKTKENYDPIDSRNNSPSNELVSIKTNGNFKLNIKSKL